jgi:hypothetical protein
MCSTPLFVALSLATAHPLGAQASELLTLGPDAPRWELQGRTSVAEMAGRRCLMINGGAATIRDFTMQDGIIDVQVLTTGVRGFFGIEFRSDEANSEYVYLRPHKSGLPDAVQYTPVLNTGLNWQLYSGEGFTGRMEIPSNTWLHLRLELRGAAAKLFVGDTLTPVLTMSDLKSGVRKGGVALAVLTGSTCFSEVQVRTKPSAPWQREVKPMPAGILASWSLSPAYEAVERDVERPLTASQISDIKWQDVEAESPGLVAINRYRESPHPKVTFQSDFSTRLNPQPGSKVVFARTIITANRAELRRLHLGYSDEVTVFLNGTPLFRGRSAQSFRDPGFLGIMDPENDAVFVPLRAGRNELILAVTEFGGGWGFIARLDPPMTNP